MIREKSAVLFEASKNKIPGGVNSPVRAFPGLDMTPLMAAKGRGSHVWDVDGNSFIDYCCSWGALILGHAHPFIVEAATHQLHRGSSFGMATPYEEMLASKICTHLPSIEKIRFVSSGTEATMTALRLARGATGKSKIVKFIGHYHGHSDALLVRAGSGTLQLNSVSSSKGVPTSFIEQTICLPFNDLEACRDFLRQNDDIAAVILEPIAANMGLVPADPDFLSMLREETDRKEIVLIFDEVISGFRVGLQGAQGLYGITPDLTCLGKIIGGGFPAAAFGGRSDLMDHLAPLGEVYQAGTLSGNSIAMCAAIATFEIIEQSGFYDDLEEKTTQLALAIRRWMKDTHITGCVSQVGSMFTPFFGHTSVKSLVKLDQNLYAHFFKTLFNQNIYLAPSPYEANFISSAHSQDDIDRTISAIN
jgi:glutamate-1-semialdehyde 2,1-aminomutase